MLSVSLRIMRKDDKGIIEIYPPSISVTIHDCIQVLLVYIGEFYILHDLCFVVSVKEQLHAFIREHFLD